MAGHVKLCEPYKTLLSKLLEETFKKFGDGLVSFVVYGSVARCESRKDSDIDILIVAKNLPRSRLKRQELFIEIEEEIQHEIDKLEAEGYNVDFSPIIKTPEEASKISPLYLDMVEDAVILFDRDHFFNKILENIRNRLMELGAERVKLGKRWYWRLKRDYKFGDVIKI